MPQPPTEVATRRFDDIYWFVYYTLYRRATSPSSFRHAARVTTTARVHGDAISRSPRAAVLLLRHATMFYVAETAQVVIRAFMSAAPARHIIFRHAEMTPLAP